MHVIKFDTPGGGETCFQVCCQHLDDWLRKTGVNRLTGNPLVDLHRQLKERELARAVNGLLADVVERIRTVESADPSQLSAADRSVQQECAAYLRDALSAL